MVLVKSSLGNFLRWDCEDFIRDTRGAAQFASADEANGWIETTYGRNGLRYFFPAYVKDRDDVNRDED